MKKWLGLLVACCLALCIPVCACAQEEYTDAFLLDFFAEYSIEELLELQEMIRAELLRRDYQDESIQTWVLNTNTDKFHFPDCKSVKQIKDKNRFAFTGDREQLILLGFEPCGNCHP